MNTFPRSDSRSSLASRGSSRGQHPRRTQAEIVAGLRELVKKEREAEITQSRSVSPTRPANLSTNGQEEISTSSVEEDSSEKTSPSRIGGFLNTFKSLYTLVRSPTPSRKRPQDAFLENSPAPSSVDQPLRRSELPEIGSSLKRHKSVGASSYSSSTLRANSVVDGNIQHQNTKSNGTTPSQVKISRASQTSKSKPSNGYKSPLQHKRRSNFQRSRSAYGTPFISDEYMEEARNSIAAFLSPTKATLSNKSGYGRNKLILPDKINVLTEADTTDEILTEGDSGSLSKRKVGFNDSDSFKFDDSIDSTKSKIDLFDNYKKSVLEEQNFSTNEVSKVENKEAEVSAKRKRRTVVISDERKKRPGYFSALDDDLDESLGPLREEILPNSYDDESSSPASKRVRRNIRGVFTSNKDDYSDEWLAYKPKIMPLQVDADESTKIKQSSTADFINGTASDASKNSTSTKDLPNNRDLSDSPPVKSIFQAPALSLAPPPPDLSARENDRNKTTSFKFSLGSTHANAPTRPSPLSNSFIPTSVTEVSEEHNDQQTGNTEKNATLPQKVTLNQATNLTFGGFTTKKDESLDRMLSSDSNKENVDTSLKTKPYSSSESKPPLSFSFRQTNDAEKAPKNNSAIPSFSFGNSPNNQTAFSSKDAAKPSTFSFLPNPESSKKEESPSQADIRSGDASKSADKNVLSTPSSIESERKGTTLSMGAEIPKTNAFQFSFDSSPIQQKTNEQILPKAAASITPDNSSGAKEGFSFSQNNVFQLGNDDKSTSQKKDTPFSFSGGTDNNKRGRDEENKTDTIPSSFTFGSGSTLNKPAAGEQKSSEFSFGKTQDDKAAKIPSFSFTSTINTALDKNTNATPQFSNIAANTPNSSTTGAPNPFQLASTSNTPSQPLSFNFGGAQNTQPKSSGFTNPSTDASSTNTSPKIAPSTPTFSFTQPAQNTSLPNTGSDSQFSFGLGSSSNSSQPQFNFGNTSSTNQPFSFGQTSTTSTDGQTSNLFSFGQAQPASSNAPFVFGQSSEPPKSPSIPSNNTLGSAGGFNVGINASQYASDGRRRAVPKSRKRN